MKTNTTCNPYYYKDGVKHRLSDEALHRQKMEALQRAILAELRRVKGE